MAESAYTDQEVLAAIESEIKYIIDDASTEYFINEYCWIENKDNVGSSVIKFKTWPSQIKALIDIIANRLSIVLKARQLGMTWLILCYISHMLIKYGGYTAIGLSKTEDDAKELINRVDLILRHMPKWLIITEEEYKKIRKKGKYTGFWYQKSALEITIIRYDRENSRMKAMAASRSAGRSLTADIILIDEWAFQMFAEEIWEAVFPTINRPGSGKMIGLSTNKRGSLFEYIWKHAAEMGFARIFLSWRADPRRTQEWYENTKNALRKNKKYMQEYPETPEEALAAGEGTAFPEFSEGIHVCTPFKIPDHWRRWAAIDNGYNDPFAWYKMAVSEDGIVYVYYEYSRWREDATVGYSDQARKFSSDMYETDPKTGQTHKEKLDYAVLGADAWHKDTRFESGKDLTDFYREGGLNDLGFIHPITDRRLRKATFHEYLKPYYDENLKKYTAKLQIFSTCTYLTEILPQLVVDENDPEKVADMSDFDNPYDAVGYGLISYHTEKSKPVSSENTRVQEHKRQIIEQHKRKLSAKLRRK